MEEGREYIIVGEFKEGGGADYLTVRLCLLVDVIEKFQSVVTS